MQSINDNAQQKIAHLTFIQGIITRMGSNSFLIKGWSVTLVAATFALSSKDSNKLMLLIAYFPIFMFWILDSFFLSREAAFRKLYESVARGEISSENFTLDTSSIRCANIIYSCFTKTIWPFYGFIALIVLFAMVILR